MKHAAAKLVVSTPNPPLEVLPTPFDTVIAEARDHAKQAGAKLRQSVEHALLAGLRIWWLHDQKPMVHGGDRRSENFNVTHVTLKSFVEIVSEIGIDSRTAYRWKNAVEHAVVWAAREDMIEVVPAMAPEPGTPEFVDLENTLRQIAQTTSLRRLMLGASTQKTSEELRYQELIGAAEHGSQIAADLLERVESGELSLEAAIKALGGAEATRDKARRDPVYFQTTFEGEIGGLFSKSITTLKTGFLREFPKLDPNDRARVIKKGKDFIYEIKEVIEAVEAAEGGVK